MDRYNLVSAAGIVVLMALAWLGSENRRLVNWRAVGWGLVLQLMMGALVFLMPGSTRVMLRLNDAVLKLLKASQAGQEFVFGHLAKGQNQQFVLATQALPLVIFFAALMGLLYYWRIMPAIIRGFAWLFTRLMRVSGAESLCAASNIFVGVESLATIRPYLNQMTRSELCVVLTAGMATVASTTMGIYVGMLQDCLRTIAGHLISASIMSAPAAILTAKLLVPETGQPLTLGRNVKPAEPEDSGAIDAIVNGAMAGVRLLVGIVALLIAFLGLLAVVNLLLGGVGNWFGLEVSLDRLLGYVFRPLAMVMGVPPGDAQQAGQILGKRLVATEVPAYLDLAAAIRGGTLAHPRSAVIIAYALCGFAHVASLAIFVGGAAAVAPNRRKDLVSVGPRALLAATLACLMTGAVAGTFFHTAHIPLTTTAPAP